MCACSTYVLDKDIHIVYICMRIANQNQYGIADRDGEFMVCCTTCSCRMIFYIGYI